MIVNPYAKEISPQTDGLADGPPNTTGTWASCLNPQKVFTLKAYFIKLGTRLIIKASGEISSVVTTPGTARFDLTIGGTIVFDSKAILLDTVVAHSQAPWFLYLELLARQGGGFGCAFWPSMCFWACEDILGVPATPPKGSIIAMLPWNTLPPVLQPSFDNSKDGLLDLNFTQTAATGTLLVHDYSVQVANDANL